MSYLGYVPFMESFLKYRSEQKNRKVGILEIGVDTGQTTLPLLANMVHSGIDFDMVCVDIRQNNDFLQQILVMPGVNFAGVVKDHNNPEEIEKRNYNYVIENSLDFLPKLINRKERGFIHVNFDLVLLDGDHNYETVSKELRYIRELINEDSMIIIDDYHGRYSHMDGFYAGTKGHENLAHKDLKRNEEKQGVKAAVDDFVKENPEFTLYDVGTQVAGEVVCLSINTGIQLYSEDISCWNGKEWQKKTLCHRLSQTWTFQNMAESVLQAGFIDET